MPLQYYVLRSAVSINPTIHNLLLDGATRILLQQAESALKRFRSVSISDEDNTIVIWTDGHYQSLVNIHGMSFFASIHKELGDDNKIIEGFAELIIPNSSLKECKEMTTEEIDNTKAFLSEVDDVYHYGKYAINLDAENKDPRDVNFL